MDVESNWQLITFGHPHIKCDGKVVKLKRRKSLALLLYLVFSQRPCARQSLAAMFWPDADDVSARTNLRSALADLNQAFGSHWMSEQDGAICIDQAFQLQSDYADLTQAVHSNQCHLDETSLDTWQLCLFEGLSFDACDAFEEWLYIQRQTARELFQNLLLKQLTLAEQQQRQSLRSQLALRLIRFDPLCEAGYLSLMQSAYAQGDHETALSYYQTLCRTLEHELGIEPQSDLKRLANAIEQGEAYQQSPAHLKDVDSLIGSSDVHYALNEGVHLAYKTIGNQKPVIVIIWGFVSHLDQLTDLPSLKEFFYQLALRFTVVLFDKRGVGLSDRVAIPAGLDQTASDVICILNDMGVKQACVFGFSEGGPAAISCAYLYPDRIHQLVLYGTAAKWVRSADYTAAIPEERYDQWLDFLELNWGKANNLEHFAPSRIGDDEMTRWWSKTIRMSASPGSVKSVMDHDRHIDVRDYLPQLSQPTLVIQKKNDRMMRVENGRYLSEHIPKVSYHELSGQDHWIWAEDSREFFQVLDNFMNKNMP